ncbi:MAG: NAD(P)-binding domain-containing protein [Myxococcales bacterium]|nr:NAD(P)-binding domain-containing protein [Myxococcales bacterium]MCB9568286.1 NAD(P)-binding domain-containing protein [Myxococcales bacterium]MCB9705009.1 NAD(P)-binding domain-containing protein [Myxococcales bacterium]
MEKLPTIAIIGAGNVGGNLGVRLSQSGLEVCFGVRPGKSIDALLGRCGPGASVTSPAEAAAAAEVIFIAVPAAAAVDAARSLGDLAGKIVVDCNNPLRWDQGPVWSPPPEGSLSAAIAAACPGARVVKAFNTFGAEFHLDPTLPGGPIDVELAGDDPSAKATVAAIAERAGFGVIDAGPLRSAALLENLAILWIHLATVGGQGRTIGWRLLRRG